MKIKKGQAGYLSARKKSLQVQVLLGFGIVGALLLMGYLKTHSRTSLFTVLAVLGCLPRSEEHTSELQSH